MQVLHAVRARCYETRTMILDLEAVCLVLVAQAPSGMCLVMETCERTLRLFFGIIQ